MSSKFCWPVEPLESERVLLTPFDPEQHTIPFVEAVKDHPDLLHYLPLTIGRVPSVDSFMSEFYNPVVRDHAAVRVIYAVIDKPSGAIAGIFGYLNAVPANLSLEIGFAVTIPKFQRTYVTSNAVGLLLKYAFEWLGLRRVQWQAHNENAASRRTAERFGFKFEGISRWDRTLPDGKYGLVPKSGGRAGRHSAMYAMCWDDWEAGGRELVQKAIDRKQ